MKILEKIALLLFSTLILILSIIFCLLIFGWIDINFIGEVIENLINDSWSSNIALGLCIVFILLAVRCIFFDSSSKKVTENSSSNGVLLENADGKLFITKETIENLIINVVKGFDSAEDVTTKVELDKDNNVSVYVELNARENAIIKELSTNLQTKIKETVKKASDLEVKEVNIKVKNIEPEKIIVEEY